MRILLATDGRASAIEARRLITQTFEPTAVEITVATVEEPETVLPDSVTFSMLQEGEALRRARQVAESEAQALAHGGFATRVATGYGPSPLEIENLACTHEQQMIVLGARSRHAHGILPLGSVSLNVLHRTRASVLIVHRAPAGPPRIAIALDEHGAFQDEVDLLSSVVSRRCPLEVISVAAEAPSYALATAGVVYPIEFSSKAPEQERLALERARVRVDWVAAQLGNNGFACRTHVFTGRASADLPRYLKSTDADVAVVGSSGLGRVARAFLGSVSERVVRTSPATMVVRNGSRSGD